MKSKPLALIVCTVAVAFLVVSPMTRAQKNDTSAKDDLVYADFQETKYDRPASSRGGFVQIFSYQQNSAVAPKFKGMEGANPAAPELVKLSKDDQNTAASFDFEFLMPNEYEGVIMEVIGRAEGEDGKGAADDVSGYSFLTLQASASGVSSLGVEFLSQGQGIDLNVGSPQATIQIKPGFNVYKIPLASLAQPSWAPTKVNAVDVLKKLTAINVIASCGPCAATKGKVVVDNIVFHH